MRYGSGMAIRAALVVLLIPWALVGCDDFFKDPFGGEKYDEATKTPDGHRVFVEDLGSISGGSVTLDEALVEFDAAYRRAALSVSQEHGVPLDVVMGMDRERRVYWNLLDRAVVFHEDAPQGVHTWIFPSGSRHIDICAYEPFYSDDPGDVDPASPAWTRATLTNYRFEGVTYPTVYVWGDPNLDIPFPGLEEAVEFLLP